MKSKVLIFLSVFSLLAVLGIQDLHAIEKVSKTYYYACHCYNPKTKEAWVTDVKSVTVYDKANADHPGYSFSVALKIQWENYMIYVFKYLSPGTLLKDYSTDKKEVLEYIRKRTAEYSNDGFRVTTKYDFEYKLTKYDKSPN